MKWEGHRESDNVEDARGGGGGGGPGPRLGGGRGLGLGGVVIALLAAWLFGVNPMTVLGLMDGGGNLPGQAPAGPVESHPQDAPARFVSIVLADTEDVWGALFQAAGRTYQAPRLRLFEGVQPTACGRGDSAMGPFYCPGDQKVYIDLAFFATLRERLGAPGDFAQAYVVAHEVGHHVQHLLGISAKVEAARRRASEREANALSVRLELQADCLAGVWAHHSQRGKGWLEAGDVEEAMNAAAQIGDDTLQRRGQGRVVPESFTHGTSAQRQEWFKRGLASGQMNTCDTFAR